MHSLRWCPSTLNEVGTTLCFLLPQIQNNLQKDIHELGFYCTARKEGDEILDWMQSSRDIFNFIRAICRPGPEARVFLGEKEIKIKG